MRRTILIAMLLALGGCAAVGPDYRLPKDSAAAAAEDQGPFLSANSRVKSEPLPDHWWQLFNDPVLDALVEEALAANTDFRVAQSNLERSLALLDARNAGREIQAGVNAETSYSQRSAEAELHHVKPPLRQIYNGGVSASYDLDLFGGLRRGVEAASADMEAAVAARDLVRVNVAAETARAYSDICNTGYQLDILGRQVSLQERGVSLTGMLVRNGRAVPYERDRRQSALDATKARLPRLAARQRNAAFRLAALLGRMPRQAALALLSCRHPLVLRDPVPIGDGQALLRRRPDIRMAERRLAAATARIGVATAALYPDIHFGASVGSTGAAADFLSPLTNRFGLGPLLSWTLNRHAGRARIDAAEAQGRAELAAFDGSVLKALREVEIALNSYAGGVDQQASLDRSRDEAARVAQHTRQLRRGGKIAELTALDAERDFLLAEQTAAEGRAAINEDQIALFLALGGGWTVVRTATPGKSGDPEARIGFSARADDSGGN